MLAYRVLADIAVIVHLAFVVFVVFGGLLVIRWQRLGWLHLPAAIWGAAIEFSGAICPLTPLENVLREAGGQARYSGDFVERYVIPLVYPIDLTRTIQLALGCLVVAINLGVYGLMIARARKRMLDSATLAAPWVRVVDVPGGSLKRLWLHFLLRRSTKGKSYLDANIDAMRIQQRKWDERYTRTDPLVRRTPVAGAGFAGEWIDCPGSRPERVILYLHGGAFMFHWPGVYTAMVADLCRRLKARALMVNYRLAPEHPFPAATNDCHAAYSWLLTQGHEPKHIVLAGDSAGGNLALVTLQRLRGADQPMPACAVLMSAGVDFTLSSRSMVVNQRRDPMLSLVDLVSMRGFYAQPELFADPWVSPLFGDFAGLPPLLFQVGSREVLLDESTRAAARASAAGVAVTVEIWKRMGHVFQAMPLPQAAVALDGISRFVAQHTNWDWW
jgi:acetyl esterase/lipase